MAIDFDPVSLENQYRQMSDEEFASLHRETLTAEAAEVYDRVSALRSSSEDGNAVDREIPLVVNASKTNRRKRLLVWGTVVVVFGAAWLYFGTRPMKMATLHNASMNGNTKYCDQGLSVEGTVSQIHNYGGEILDYYLTDDAYEFVAVRYDPHTAIAPNVGDRLRVLGFLQCENIHPNDTKYFSYTLLEKSRTNISHQTAGR